MGETERKSIVLYVPWSLLILFLFYAALGILGICLGYTLVLYHAWLQSAMVAALLLTAVIIAFRRKILLDARAQVGLNLLFPMSICFQLYLSITYVMHDGYLQMILCILSGIITIVSMLRLFFRYRFCIPLKIVCGTISAILIGIWLLVACLMACVAVVGIFESFFGEFGKSSVVKEVLSPDQNYVAEVVDDDQGALGGNTYVTVRWSGQQKQKKEIPVLVGKLVPGTLGANGKTVYEGSWGEFETMDIKWKNNHILLIDGKEYIVDLD